MPRGGGRGGGGGEQGGRSNGGDEGIEQAGSLHPALNSECASRSLYHKPCASARLHNQVHLTKTKNKKKSFFSVILEGFSKIRDPFLHYIPSGAVETERSPGAAFSTMFKKEFSFSFCVLVCV